MLCFTLETARITCSKDESYAQMQNWALSAVAKNSQN